MRGMDVEPLAIPEVLLLTPRRFGDDRGFFSETFRADVLRDLGITANFVQDNHSRSAAAGVVRGLHYQRPPQAQGKLLRVIAGSVFDVAVDFRVGSPTFGRWVGATLSAQNGVQIWVPPGFLHGFCTLEPGTEVLYKVTEYYAPELDAGIFWNDPALGIDWPVSPEAAILSAKDAVAPGFHSVVSPFEFGAC